MKLSNSTSPPLVAKIICIMTYLTAGRTLLQSLSILPLSKPMQTAWSQGHIIRHQALAFIEASILLTAAFFLWKMSKLAPKLFLIEFGVTAAALVYSTYFSPNESQVYILQHDHMAVVLAFGFTFIIESFRFLYAWWVTSDRYIQKRSEVIESQ